MAKFFSLSNTIRSFTFLLTYLLWCSFSFNTAHAQAKFRDTKITDEQLERLKTKTVVLVLPSSQYDYLNDYREMAPRAWTLTPIEVVKFSDMAGYTDPGKYAIFSIYALTTSSQNIREINYWLTLSLPSVKEGRKKT